MRLFYATNTIAVAAAIALEEAGLAYEPMRVDFASAEQKQPEYLAINSKGRVPALERQGQIITEVGAILELIAALAPSAELVPTDPLEAAKMRSVMFYLASTVHVNHAHKGRGHRWADLEDSWADMKAKVPETMTASTHFIETECLQGPLVLGQSLTLADAYLFTICTWLEGDGVRLDAFPKVRAFMAAMNERDAVKAVRAKGIMT